LTASRSPSGRGTRSQTAPASRGRRDTKGAGSKGFISWIVVGAIAGFLANLVMGSRQGLLMMVVLGIVGGLVGGFIAASVLNMGSVNGINIESIIIATLGAILVVFAVNFFTGRRSLRQG
jgi:uncharacterized membrane protein YeaQ/YmgE (transglycosylase-associated protein family)